MRYLIASAIGASLILAGTTFADTINVPGDYATIQAAVDAAVDGDEVVVAPGTYTSTDNCVVSMMDKAITLRASGSADETIIDGEYERYCILNNGFIGDVEMVIDGFTCRNGGVNSISMIMCSPTIRNCTIRGTESSWSGGLSLQLCSSTVTDCHVVGNFTDNYGGGVYCFGGVLSISDCLIEDNNACFGGGVYLRTCAAVMTDTTISGNLVQYDINTQTDAEGGGIFCSSGTTLTISNCTIADNVASGIYWETGHGAGLYCSEDASVAVIGSVITGNDASIYGGGIFYNGGDQSTLSISSCLISGNESEYGGGISANSDGTVIISDTSIHDNLADKGGAGLSLAHDYSCYVAITGSSIQGNVVDDYFGQGGGILSGGDQIVTLMETTVCNNSHEQIVGFWVDKGGNWVNEECLGACCLGTDCIVSTASDCLALGGVDLGDDVSCDSYPCTNCPVGEVEDCFGSCFPIDWIGDGYCDDGSDAHNGIPIYLNCTEFNCDGGDCICCPEGEIFDCNGNCCPENWLGDGACDDGSYEYNGVSIYLDCERYDCDGGDCICCPDGEMPDCNGNCFPANWVGDDICDNGAENWNGVPIYLDCGEFECDGGDCICCPGDINGDGQTNIEDLLLVIGGWADLYGVEDLLSVLDDWGCGG